MSLAGRLVALLLVARAPMASAAAPGDEAHWLRAVREDPRSEPAWWALQRLRLAAGRWEAALEAGAHLLAVDPNHASAWKGQGWAYAHLGQWARAREAYARALALDPTDAEAALGLGTSALYTGAWDVARRACRRARDVLGEDPRVVRCLARASRALQPKPFAWVAGSWWSYTDRWNAQDVAALAAAGGVYWPRRGGAWLGTSVSRTRLDYDVRDYRQLAAAAGGRLDVGAWRLGVSGSWTWASHDAYDGIPILVASVGWSGARWFGDGELALSRWPGGAWGGQATAGVGWRHGVSGPWVRLAPVVSAWKPVGRAAEVLVAGRVEGGIPVASQWRVGAALAAGAWRHRVEAGGLGVWTGDERYVFGYRVGVAWRPVAAFDIFAAWHHAVGDEQAGRPHRFQRLGATLGVGWATW